MDIGAKRPLAAQRGDEKIVVESKSFASPSPVHDLEVAVGQFVLYRALLRRYEEGRTLFLAVPEVAYLTILSEEIAQPVLEDERITLIVFDPRKEEILKWMR